MNKSRCGSRTKCHSRSPDSSSGPQTVEYGTANTLTGHVLDPQRVNLEMRAEISNIVSRDSNEMVISRTSAETSVTAWNDRYLVWAAVEPTTAGPGTNRHSVYIMVKPHINLPSQGLANVAEDRRPDGTPPRQVLLDVRTVTANRQASSDLGIEWQQTTTKAGVFPDRGGTRTGSAPDLSFTDSLLAVLDLLQKNGQAQISSQQILTQERHQSQIKALKEEWSTRAEPRKTETGTIITVRPHVASNNSAILLNLTIHTTRRLPTPPGSDLPMRSSSECQTTITLQDGSTAAVGGLSNNGTGATDPAGQETVIFVTPHLVQDGNDTPVRAAQAAAPDVHVAPPTRLTPEQISDPRREYVNSDPQVSGLSKRIVTVERDLITQQARTSTHRDVALSQAVLEILKRCLAERRSQLEQEFDNGLPQQREGRTGSSAERRPEATLTATFANTDLRDVLAEIAKQTGVTITPDATVKATPITAEFVQVSIDAALQQVLKNTGYHFRKADNGTYLVFWPLSNSFMSADLGSNARAGPCVATTGDVSRTPARWHIRKSRHMAMSRADASTCPRANVRRSVRRTRPHRPATESSGQEQLE